MVTFFRWFAKELIEISTVLLFSCFISAVLRNVDIFYSSCMICGRFLASADSASKGRIYMTVFFGRLYLPPSTDGMRMFSLTVDGLKEIPSFFRLGTIVVVRPIMFSRIVRCRSVLRVRNSRLVRLRVLTALVMRSLLNLMDALSLAN